MRFALDTLQEQQFKQQKWIAVQGLFKDTDILSLKEILTSHMVDPSKKGSHIDFLTQFKASRDLWRIDERLKSIVSRTRILSLIAELVQERPLRLALDQALILSQGQEESKYFKHPLSLNQFTSIQGLVAGLLICIEPGEYLVDPLPQEPGECTIVHPDLTLPMDALEESKKGLYYLISYASKNAVYRLGTHDPIKNYLRDFEYTQGDLLSNRSHPIVYL